MLTGEQVRALRSVQHGHIFPDRHRAMLIEAGYLRPTLAGTVVLTDLARARLAVEPRHG